MAQRRMFSQKIIDTDTFLDMPVSARELYFQFGMRADDDGFVPNPKRIIKMIGASDDDIKVLIAKKFIIPFESGVCVISDWKIHNYIQKDRYQETQFKAEKALLTEDQSGKYMAKEKTCIQNVYKMDTQVRLGKGRERVRVKTSCDESVAGTTINNILDLFKNINPSYQRLYSNKTQRSALSRLIKTHGEEKIKMLLNILPKTNKNRFAPKIFTPMELERDLGRLLAFLQQDKNQNSAGAGFEI